MTIRDEEQIRGWALDYAIRLHPKDEVVKPGQVIAEAKMFERYMTNQRPAKMLKLAKDNDKK